MDKKRMILASLASAAVLGAGFTTVQPLVVKADGEAEAKVAEAQAKVAEATAKLEREKKEAAEAEAAKAKAAEAKKEADAKFTESEKKAAAEAADVTSAQKAKEEADAELTKAKAAAEVAAQTEFLANFEKSVQDTIKELEENAKNNPELEEQIKGFIAEFKKQTAEKKAKFVEDFQKGLTAEQAEKEVEKVAKAEEEAEATEAKEEADAQAAILANFDKALEDTIEKFKNVDTKGDEGLEKQIQETIKALRAEAAETRKNIEEGFKNGLTAEDAEEAIAEANKKFAVEEAKKEETKKEEADNKDALKVALEKLEKEAEDRINKDNRIKSEDKAKVIEEAKAVIGKDALLKAIEDGEIKATEAAKELENQSNTANETSATEQEGKPLADLPAEDKKELDKAYNKEASKPIVEKLTDIADDLAEKIEKLAEVAEKDKADSTTKAEKFEKQNETLEKVTVAVELAKKNSSNQAVLDALQIAEKQLQADTKEAKTKFDEVHESLQANTEEINELADEYNEILGSIEGVSKTPTVEALPEYTGAVATKGDEAAPTVEALPEYTESVATNTPADENGEAVLPPVENNEYNGSLGTAGDEATPKVEVPEYNDGVSDDEAPTSETPEYNGGVSDEEAPVEPAKPEAPKPAEKSEAEKKVETLETEVTALEELLATNNNNKAIKDLLNSRRSALARAEKALNTTKPATPTFAVLAAELEVPTASEALKAEVAKLEEELKTADASKKEELTKKLEALKADLSLVEKAEKEADLKDDLKALEPKEDKVVFSKGQVLPPVQAEAPEFTGNVNGVESAVNEVPEFGANKPEIKKILKEIGEVRTQIEDGEENGAEPYYIEGLKERLNDLLEAFDILNDNKPAVNEVPEYKLPATPAQSVTPTVAGTSKDKTYQAPAAKEEAKKVLPNTGGKESAALASAGFLGLVLGALPFAKRKN